MGGSAWIPVLDPAVDTADWAGIQSAIDAQTGTTDPLADYPGDGVGPGDAGYASHIRFSKGPIRLLGLTDARINRPLVLRSVSGAVIDKGAKLIDALEKVKTFLLMFL